MSLDLIPQSLKIIPHWICWRISARNGKPVKLPLNARTLKAASSTEPADWCDFETAAKASARPGIAGVGFVFTRQAGIAGIDLDGCIVDGVLTDAAAALLDRFAGTYVERTPSGKGLHIILAGSKPDGVTKCKAEVVHGCKQIEIYDNGRYFTFTGDRHGDAGEVIDCAAALGELCASLWPALPALPAELTLPLQAPAAAASLPPAADRQMRWTRCMAYAKTLPEAVSGQGGSEKTLRVACDAYRFGLDDAGCMEVLHWFNDNKCPAGDKWNEAELQHKMESARDKCGPGKPEWCKLLNEQRGERAASLAVGGTAEPWTMFPPTDAGNGERFARMHGDKVKFAGGDFYIYDGKRYRRDNEHVRDQLAKETARAIMLEAHRANELATREKLSDWAIKSESAARLEAMVSRARSEPEIRLPMESFDADPWAFNLQNGTLDLRTGELRPHRREDFITKISPVTFDRSATCELWINALKDWLPNDNEILFAQLAAGYSLTGQTDEEKFFCLFGPEASGKTCFAEALKMIAGDYATTADFESFIKRTHSAGGNARGDIARLAGSRIVTASETDDGREMGAGLIKNLTGKERITARHLYRDEFEFMPAFKLWLLANHPPYIDPDDGAMWRRLIRLPFTHAIPADKRDPSIKRRLLNPNDTGPGVLNWAVAGVALWRQYGLPVPDSVKAATDEIRNSMDSSAEFFDDRLDFGQLWQAISSDVRLAYTSWADGAGVSKQRRLGPKGMAKKLRSRGCTDERDGNGNRYWSGVRIK